MPRQVDFSSVRFTLRVLTVGDQLWLGSAIGLQRPNPGQAVPCLTERLDEQKQTPSPLTSTSEDMSKAEAARAEAAAEEDVAARIAAIKLSNA